MVDGSDQVNRKALSVEDWITGRDITFSGVFGGDAGGGGAVPPVLRTSNSCVGCLSGLGDLCQLLRSSLGSFCLGFLIRDRDVGVDLWRDCRTLLVLCGGSLVLRKTFL